MITFLQSTNLTAPATLKIIVLELQAGNLQDEVVCTTESVLLSSDPSYETVSYVWGDSATKANVVIDGAPRSVTQTVLQVLQRLRLTDRKRHLWIDQLCIDQDNDKIKSQQVDCMHDIYRKATHNNIWLGDIPSEAEAGFSDQDVSDVFDLLTRLDPDHQDDPERPFPWNSGCQTPERFGEVILALMGSSKARWRHVRWWYRVWTVQEAKMPRISTISWGDHSVSFNALLRIASQMTRSWEFCQLYDEAFHLGHLANEFCVPLMNLQIQDPAIIMGTLFRWRPRLATEPKDKVFAMMALFPDEASPPFPSVPFCDYSLSVQELYTRVTLDLIRRHAGLLPLCGRRGEPRATPDLPTWVMDWVAPADPEKRTMDYYGHCWRYDFFDAPRGKYVEPKVTSGPDSRGLELQGLRVDRIAVLGPVNYISNAKQAQLEPAAYDEQTRTTVRAWLRVLKTWLLTQPSGSTYLGQHSMTPHEAFCRTMTSDLMDDGTTEPVRRASTEDALKLDGFLDETDMTAAGSVGNMARSQAFFITEKGYFGIGPPEARIGDEVWVLFCGKVPHVLRPRGGQQGTEEDRGGFEYVGDAYVQGIMDGELVDEDTDGQTVVIF